MNATTKRKRAAFIVFAALILLIVVVVLITRRSTSDSEQAAVTAMVRQSFPHFCVGSALHIEPSPLAANEISVGCERNWTQFGPALSINPDTCHFMVMSLTLASELGDVAALNGQLLGCPTATLPGSSRAP